MDGAFELSFRSTQQWPTLLKEVDDSHNVKLRRVVVVDAVRPASQLHLFVALGDTLRVLYDDGTSELKCESVRHTNECGLVPRDSVRSLSADDEETLNRQFPATRFSSTATINGDRELFVHFEDDRIYLFQQAVNSLSRTGECALFLCCDH